MNRLLAFLCRRFGLRFRRLPMAIRNPRQRAFAPGAGFKVVRDADGCDYILPRAMQ